MFEYRVDRFGRKWVSCELFDFGKEAGCGAIARVNIDQMDKWICKDELHYHFETTHSFKFLKGSDTIDLSEITKNLYLADGVEEEDVAKDIWFIHVYDRYAYGIQETMWVCICDGTYKYTDERIGVIWSLTDEPCFDMDEADQLDDNWRMEAYNTADYHWLYEQLYDEYYNWYDWFENLEPHVKHRINEMMYDALADTANSCGDYLEFEHDHYELIEDKFYKDCKATLFENIRKFFASPEFGPHKRKVQRERWLKLC